MLCIFQIFSNYMVETKEQLRQSAIRNFFAKFGIILDVYKSFSKDTVNGNEIQV